LGEEVRRRDRKSDLIRKPEVKTSGKTFFQKGVDILAGILYNNGRSEEERKTPGPTADLPFFKLYAYDHTTCVVCSIGCAYNEL
jgi:hypothetical protein